MLSRAELAYVAGVLDAMGRVRVEPADSSGTLMPYVGISSANLGPLQHLARLTGVGVTMVRRDYMRVGCALHCAKRHRHVESVTGRWQLTGARARVVLVAVRPYLVALADEVDAVLDLTADAPSKAATTTKMRALGWPTRSGS